MEYLIDERYVSSLLYHYTSISYFFSGRTNLNLFFLRKAQPFKKLSNFAIFDVLSILVNTNIRFSSASIMVKDESILRDVLFESQDFKHSFTFEIV